jgi:FtsH-binding integral membrane protein
MLRTIHAELRWIVAILAVVVIVKFAIGLIRGSEYGKADRALMSTFVGFTDISLLLGLILLVQLGLNSMARIEHATTMIIAIAIGHSNAAWKKKGSQTKFRNNLIVAIAVLALIFVGVMRLRGSFF